MVVNLPGRGRKRKKTSRQDTGIVRKSKKNPRLSAPKITEEVKNDFHIDVHPQTIKRTLHVSGLKGEIKKIKPWILAAAQRKRLRWARAIVNWTPYDWSKVIFTDVSKVLFFGSDGVNWGWLKPGESFKKQKLEGYSDVCRR